MAKVPYPVFKKPMVGSKTFDFVFIGYAQNSAVYRFMCWNEIFIYDRRDAELSKHVFPLKREIKYLSVSIPFSSDSMHEIGNNIACRIFFEIVNTSGVMLEIEPGRSKRQRLSRYTPNKDHWIVLHCLLRYLKGTINYCLYHNKFSVVLDG